MKHISRVGIVIMVVLSVIIALIVPDEVEAASKLKKPKVIYSATSSEIVLSWGEVTGAKSYIVQRKTANGYKTLAKTKDTSYTDSDVYSSEVYLYRVRAFAKKNGKKLYSPWKKIKAKLVELSIKNVSPEQFDKRVSEIDGFIEYIRTNYTDIRKDNRFIQGETYTGTAYYISNDGDDRNDGKSITTPWKTLDRLITADLEKELNAGDAVFFRRGDTFRGHIECVEGVTYASYGTGKKPVITGSPENGTGSSKWILYGKTADGSIIWEFYKDMTDCGNLYFDELPLAMHKQYPVRKNGRYVTGDREFDPCKDLINDLDFVSFADSKLPYNMDGFVDVGGGSIDHSVGKLYLRCDKGNPGELFKSIEFATSPDGISSIIGINREDVTLLDLDIRIVGQCGIGIDKPGNGYLIKGCEVSLCGGYTCYFRDGVSEPGGDGVVCCGSNGIFEYNYFHDNGGQGITVECGYMGQKTEIEGIHIVNNAFNRHASGAIQFVCFGQDLTDPTVFKDMEVDHNYIFESIHDCWSYPTMSHGDYGADVPSGECMVLGLVRDVPLVTDNFSIHDNIMYSADGSAIFGMIAGNPYQIFKNNIFLFSDINHPMAIITLDGVDRDWYRFNGDDMDGEILMNKTIGSGNEFVFIKNL